LYLSRFDFMLKHVLESKADSLSRRPDWEVEVEKDNKDETLVKPSSRNYSRQGRTTRGSKKLQSERR